MTGRGTGWIEDERDARDWVTRAMFGAVRGLPNEAMGLVDHVRRINDQGQTSACVGQAISKAIDTRLRKLGLAAPEPSAQAIYTGARRLGATPGERMIDAGCQPRDAMKACRDLGVPPESAWPLDPNEINEELPLDVLAEASKFLLFQWSRVDAVGKGRSDQVAQALANGYPVVFGSDLDAAFFDYQAGDMMVQGPESNGGHMLCLLGYRHDAKGVRLFRGINSWGTTWGESGLFWVGDAWLNSPRVSDVYAIAVSP